MKEDFKKLGLIKRQIIKTLWRNKEKRREQLVEALKLPRTTIYDNLAKGNNSLLGRGVVEKRVGYEKMDGRGRPPTLWSLTKDFINEVEENLKEKSNQ